MIVSRRTLAPVARKFRMARMKGPAYVVATYLDRVQVSLSWERSLRQARVAAKRAVADVYPSNPYAVLSADVLRHRGGSWAFVITVESVWPTV